MKKLICILIAGLFIYAAAENVPAQVKPLCSNMRCQTLSRCQRQLNFQCLRGLDEGNAGCFNVYCGPIRPIFEKRALTMKVRPGSFMSEDGIKVSNKVSAPITAVFVVEDQYWVFVMKGGHVLKRVVTVGEFGEDSVEIKKGLRSGDVIVRNPVVIARRTGKMAKGQ